MEKTSYTEPHLAVIFTCTVVLVGLPVSFRFVVTRPVMLFWQQRAACKAVVPMDCIVLIV